MRTCAEACGGARPVSSARNRSAHRQRIRVNPWVGHNTRSPALSTTWPQCIRINRSESRSTVASQTVIACAYLYPRSAVSGPFGPHPPVARARIEAGGAARAEHDTAYPFRERPQGGLLPQEGVGLVVVDQLLELLVF